MSDYSYRIYAAASNTAPNFTSIDLAVADAIANDRTGSGVNGRVAASSTLYFKIDGFVASNGDTLQTIDTTTNSAAAIVVEPYSNAWNAAPRAIGATTSFDGLDFDATGQIIVSTLKTTVRNLVLRGSYMAPADGPFKFAPTAEPSGVVVEGCLFVGTGSATDSRMVRVLYDVVIRNSALLHTGTSGTNNLFSFGSAGSIAATLEQCTIASINGGASSVGIQQTSGALVLKNSYSGGTATPFGGASFAAGTTGNAGSSTDTPASGLTNIAFSTTNFENVTGGTEDLRTKSSSALTTTGATRLASALTDIFGASRQPTTTIGAFEALTGGSSILLPATHYYNQLRK